MLFFGSIFLPDTPNSLVARGLPDEARKVLARVRGTDNVDTEMEDIKDAVTLAASVPNPYGNIIKRRFWPQLMICMWMPMFQQFTGINSIM